MNEALPDDLFRHRVSAALRGLALPMSDADVEDALDAVQAEPLDERSASRILAAARESIAADRATAGAAGGVASPGVATTIAAARHPDSGEGRHIPTMVARPHARGGGESPERGGIWAAVVSCAVLVAATFALLRSVNRPLPLRDESTAAALREVDIRRASRRPAFEQAPEAPPSVKSGDRIVTAPREKRRVTMPDGSVLSINESSQVTVNGSRRVHLEQGEIYVEVQPLARASARDKSPATERFVVETPQRSVTALGTKFVVKAEPRATSVVVTQGKVRVGGVDAALTAGQELIVDDADSVKIRPAKRTSYVVEWVKELIAAGASFVPPSEHAGGSVTVVDPNGQEMKLSLRKFHVDVHIEDGFARTTIDQTYFNHTWQQLEGTFRFPLPADASLSRLAMYVNGTLMEGGMVERDHGRNVFEQIRHTRRDPALLEWVDGSTFQMRVFPLEARQEKRIILSYTQRLPFDYGKSVYRFPSGHNLSGVRLWSAEVRWKGASGRSWRSPSHLLDARDDAGDLILTGREEQALLDRDLVVEFDEPPAPVQPAKDSAAPRWSVFVQDGYRYVMFRQRPALESPRIRRERHWIFLVEHSGDRDPLMTATQRQIVKTWLESVEHGDSLSLVRASTEPAQFRAEPVPCTIDNVAAAIKFLDEQPPLGALDLGQAIDAAGRLARGDRETWIVHLGTGIPVLGERDANVLQRRLPEKARYVGIAVGKRWSKSFLETAAARTGGAVAQINPDEPVTWKAIELLSQLDAPRLTEIAVKSADATSTDFLLLTKQIAHGQELAAVARFTLDRPLPKTLQVQGRLNGRSYAQEVVLPASLSEPMERLGSASETAARDGAPTVAGHLPRTWSRQEIDRLTALGAAEHRAEIIQLSKSMYVMSPFTSLLVLETDAMYTQFNVDRGRKDHWAPYPAPAVLPPSTPEPGNQPVTPLDAAKERLVQLRQRLKSAQAQRDRAVAAKHPAADLARLERLANVEQAEERRLDLEVRRLERERLAADDPAYKAWKSVVFRSPIRWMNPNVHVLNWTRAQGRTLKESFQLGTEMDYEYFRQRPRVTLWNGQQESTMWDILPSSSTIYFSDDAGISTWRKPYRRDVARSLDGFAVDWIRREPPEGFIAKNDLMTRLYAEPAEESIPVRLVVPFGTFLRGTSDETFVDDFGLIQLTGEQTATPPRSVRRVATMSDVERFIILRDRHAVSSFVDGEFGDTVESSSRGWVNLTGRQPLGGGGGMGGGRFGNVDADVRFRWGDEHSYQYVIPFVGAGLLFDLPGYAPGLQSWEADRWAVVEQAQPDERRIHRGQVDDEARRLIERARSLGWRKFRPVDGKSRPLESWIQANGAGQFAFQRETLDGLVENVVADGRTLWHLYPDLGLGARRTLSRHHQPTLQALLPGYVPSSDDLSVDADLRMVGERTIRITPVLAQAEQKVEQKVEGEPATEAENSLPKDKARRNTVTELVFAEDGRLAEVRLVDLTMDKLLAKQTFSADGPIRRFDANGKQLAEQRYELATCDAPNLEPDVRGLVVLPMPFRSMDGVPVSVKVDLSTNAPDFAKLTDDDAMQLVASYFAAGRPSELTTLVENRFTQRGDKRVGFAVLLIALQHNHPMVVNAATLFPDAPIAAYLPQADAWIWTGNLNGTFDGGPHATPFVRRLCGIYNHYSRWRSDRGVNKERPLSDVERDLIETLKFIREVKSPAVMLGLLGAVHDAIERHGRWTPALARRMHDDVESLVADRDWPHFAAELRIRWLLAVGDDESRKQAEQRLVVVWRELIAAGGVPRLDSALREAFVKATGQESEQPCAPWGSAVRCAAIELAPVADAEANVATARRLGVVEMARQCAALGEKPLAEELATMAFHGEKLANNATLNLAVLRYAQTATNWPLAEACALRAIADDKTSQGASLWRDAAAAALQQQHVAEWARRMDRALQLEYDALPPTVDIAAFRVDYTNVMGQLERSLELARDQRLSGREELLQLLGRMAERWRDLDPEETTVCHRVAEIYAKFGLAKLAWDYWTTPLSAEPDQSAPWQRFATQMQQQGRVVDADRAWTTACECEPTNADLLLGHGEFLRSQQQTQRAREVWRRIVNGTWQPRFEPTKQRAAQLLSEVK